MLTGKQTWIPTGKNESAIKTKRTLLMRLNLEVSYRSGLFLTLITCELCLFNCKLLHTARKKNRSSPNLVVESTMTLPLDIDLLQGWLRRWVLRSEIFWTSLGANTIASITPRSRSSRKSMNSLPNPCTTLHVRRCCIAWYLDKVVRERFPRHDMFARVQTVSR